MKTIKTIIIPAIAFILVIMAMAFKPAKPNTQPADNGFAVIELFTSEGCSSCPPADALVSRIAKEYNNKPVYILAYHVDYWDRLGWRDVFSNASFSARQYAYASLLKLPQVYTPQIVVNGKTEFVGSDEVSLRNALRGTLQQTTLAQINLKTVKLGEDNATVNYEAKGNVSNSILLLALVQKTALSKVKAGENKGRNLAHVQIVRQLQTVQLTDNDSGIINVALPKDLTKQSCELIGLLQNIKTGQITAAAKIELAASI